MAPNEEMSDEELLVWEQDQEKAEAERFAVLVKEARRLAKAQVDKGKRRGVDFEVVTTLVGNFVVSKPEFVTAKRFIDKKEQTTEDTVQFVLPCILVPDRAGLGDVFQSHAGVAGTCALAILAMYEASAKKRMGK